MKKGEDTCNHVAQGKDSFCWNKRFLGRLCCWPKSIGRYGKRGYFKTPVKKKPEQIGNRVKLVYLSECMQRTVKLITNIMSKVTLHFEKL